MSGEVFTITDEQRDSVLNYEEGHFGDVKATKILPSKMSQSISAFSNTDGGELWVGISENSEKTVRTWRGFARIEDANAHIQILTASLSFGTSYSFDFLQHPNSNGYVLHIDLGKSAGIIRSSDGVAYIRRGAQNLAVTTGDQLRQLERNKGITSEVVSFV